MNDSPSHYRKLKIFSLVGFLCTLIFGLPSFNIILLLTAGIFLFRPQSYLAMLFFSGLIKNHPDIRVLPVDFTLVSLTLFTVYFFWLRLSDRGLTKNSISLSFLLIIFFFIVIISILVTPAPFEFVQNSGIYIVIMYIPLILMIINLPLRVTQYVISDFLLISLVIGYQWVGLGLHNEMIGFYPPQISDPRYPVAHLSAFGEDYMVFTTFIVLIFVEGVVQVMFWRRQLLLNSLMLIVLTYALLNSPARGLTLGLLISMILLAILWFRRPTTYKLIALITFTLGCVAFVAGYIIFFATSEKYRLINRLIDYDPTGNSISNRITSIKIGFEHWKDNILWGTGVDSVSFFSGDRGLYAHNIFLEVVFEYGIIGGMPMILFLFLTVYFAYFTFMRWRFSSPIFYTWLFGTFVVFFSFGMFSGSLGDMRTLWILMGLIALMSFETSNEMKSL